MRGGSNPPGVVNYGVLAQSEACVLSKHEVLGSKPRYSISNIRYGVVGNISACHADARGSIPRFGVFCFESLCMVQSVYASETVRSSYGHTTVKAPHPIRTAKLSTVGLDQYFGRGLQGNLQCCWALFFFLRYATSKTSSRSYMRPGRRFRILFTFHFFKFCKVKS